MLKFILKWLLCFIIFSIGYMKLNDENYKTQFKINFLNKIGLLQNNTDSKIMDYLYFLLNMNWILLPIILINLFKKFKYVTGISLFMMNYLMNYKENYFNFFQFNILVFGILVLN